MSHNRFTRTLKEIETLLDEIKKLNPDSTLLCEEIEDKLVTLDSEHDEVMTDLENMTEEKDILYDELQEKADPYDSLKESIDRYNMGVKSEQEEILNTLRDEFNLDLVCL